MSGITNDYRVTQSYNEKTQKENIRTISTKESIIFKTVKKTYPYSSIRRKLTVYRPLQYVLKNRQKPSFPIFKLPGELICLIIGKLGLKDTLSWELTCKSALDYTDNFWKERKYIKYIDFSFEATKNESQRNQFLINTAIVGYIFITCKTNKLIRDSKFLEKYQFLLNRFPFLKQVIDEDLRPKDSDFKVKSSKQRPSIPMDDALIQGWQMQRKGDENWRDLLMRAVEDGVTGAALLHNLSSPLFYNDENMPVELEEELKKKIALLAADRGDGRALQLLIKKKSSLADELFSEGKFYPAVLVAKGDSLVLSEKSNLAIEYYEKAVLAYGKRAPAGLFQTLALLYASFQDFTRSEEYLQKGIDLLEKHVDSGILHNLAHVKYSLGKLSEAERLNLRSIRSSSRNDPNLSVYLSLGIRIKIHLGKFKGAEILNARKKKLIVKEHLLEIYIDEGFLKCSLKKYREADAIYEKLFSEFGLEQDPRTLFLAAHVKYLLDDLDSAENLYNRGFSCVVQDMEKFERHYFENAERFFESKLNQADVTKETIKNAAKNKALLNKYEEADHLFDQAIEAYASDVPANLLLSAAKVKLQLKKYDEADEILKKSYDLRGEKASLSLLSLLAHSKLHRGLLEEADQLFSNIILLSENHATVLDLDGAINVKIKREQWRHADVLLSLVKRQNLVNLTFSLIYNSALVHMHFKRWRMADIFFNRLNLLQNPVQNFHFEVFANAAYTKFKLGKMEEAAALYYKGFQNNYMDLELLKGAEEFFIQFSKEKDLTKENLHLYGTIKYYQAEYEEADRIFRKIFSSFKMDEANEINANIFNDMGHIQYALKNYRDADSNFTLSMKLLGNKVYSSTLYYSAECKQKLEDFAAANQLYNQLLSQYRSAVTVNHLIKIIEFKYFMGLMTEVNALSETLIQSFEAENVDLLVKAALAKASLGLSEEAKLLLLKIQKLYDAEDQKYIKTFRHLKQKLQGFPDLDEYFNSLQNL